MNCPYVNVQFERRKVMEITENMKIAFGLAATLSLFAFFGFMPSLIYLGRGLYKKFIEKQD